MIVTGGWLDGHRIRRARVAGQCYGVRRCPYGINPGDFYVEGDPHPDHAGGFGHDRYCMAHSSDEARAALERLIK